MTRGPEKRRLGDEFPALQAFLAGYLHQDFVEEHRTAEGATRAFRREANADERRQLAIEAARFMALIEPWPWADVRDGLAALGAAWRPRSRAALLTVLLRLTH